MKILRNSVICLKCKTILDSKDENDVQSCKCGKIMISGGLKELKRKGHIGSYKEASLYETPEGVPVSVFNDFEDTPLIKKTFGRLKAIQFQCIKCNKLSEGTSKCNAICSHCYYKHKCDEIRITKVIEE